ncbi:MAG: hypothetical protein WAW90_00745 [Minisyncoccia bacterium]
MEGGIFKNWGVMVAMLFSVVLIVGAYLFARGVESPQSAQASTETALLKAIASKDSDSDGLPDWEESLYGADAHIADTFHLGMTDGEAVAKGLIVPKAIADIAIATSTVAANDGVDYAALGLKPPTKGTVTDSFAKSFFPLYLDARQANGGADLSETQINDLANKAVSQLTASIAPAPDFKLVKDIVVSGSGADAMKAFAVNAEAILTKNTVDAKEGMTDIDYFKNAVLNGDKTAYSHLASISKMYRNSAAGLAMLPVPRELATSGILFINTLMRLSEINADFARAESDPLAAMLALQQYQEVAKAFLQSSADIGNAYTAAHIALPVGVPGASFINIMVSTAAGNKKAQN